ncbi:hypothetical protein [Paenibacillus sp. MDMC362]|uniref:hypothetical protein n=1 Tax=Paenibacillus sp. MDMC362 TaxID=2977365 RepID=UPI000DC495AF|nr:hypothetical protein [Paenibacillus sp. MDMC362]RAR42446.1 hypothetical protein DP091_18775 [Paenibacillus sp. MDMC362]
MDRYQTMLALRCVLEEVLQQGDVKGLLARENEIDHLYHLLQTREEEEYNQVEIDMLNELVELNDSVKMLVTESMNQMQQTHALSSRVSRSYDSAGVNESYFYDGKF